MSTRPDPCIDALFIYTRTTPFDAPVHVGKYLLDKLADRMSLAGRQHIVVGRRLLQNHPHPFRVVARVAPVSHCVKVA